ncbi:Molybdenum cofactor sulfurase -like protein [Gossypium arboreum]|uniref:Molybdenum cofactor sulfurase-like protein n=1 Tax=Gossypium arboreum TaxID=29729 RepID=A0A0B0MRM9_GOSAR|nr:Molybdenum cofactor sulfurase -like protein [Gossypium arboreum]
MDGKEEFLKEFGDFYGYPNAPKSIDEIRSTEFKRLEDTVYLDHAGATLYSELQMEAIFKDLTTTVYGNPRILLTQKLVLDYCNASQKDYKCIFTSGATAALKLIGENFPWSCKSTFMYTMENHNSVLGLREYPATSSFGRAAAFAVDINEAVDQGGASRSSLTSFKVLQHPVQIRNEAKVLEGELTGTVAASIADIDFVRRREAVEEQFEDGTISFLSIASIRHGFKIFNTLTTSAMCWHTMSLTKFLKRKLLALRHENGESVCTLYGNCPLKVSRHDCGSIVSFNLKRPDGSWFGHWEVEKLASLYGIQLRTGCFCNPGACAKYLGLSHSDLLSNLEAGHVCWDDNDVINGKPTGAVRVSFGYMSTYEDAKKFIDFIRSSFISMPSEFEKRYLLRSKSIPCPTEGFEDRLSSSACHLKSITIYPIKSCAGFSVNSWPLSDTGLQYDREWLLKSLTGEILTQKKVPEMFLIKTFINLNQQILSVESPRCKRKLQIKLDSNSYLPGKEEFYLQSQRYEVQCYENEINQWFSDAVGQPCTLVRCCQSEYCFSLNKNRSMGMCRDVNSKVNFANEAQFLLISEESVSDLNNRLCSKTQKLSCGAPPNVNPMRFRPNLVISGGEPYAEDGWRNLRIGNTYFSSLGGCNRCQMINFYQQTGQVKKTNEPLATLASYRRVKGKILFGILLRYDPGNKARLDTNSWLKVGDEVHPNSE